MSLEAGFCKCVIGGHILSIQQAVVYSLQRFNNTYGLATVEIHLFKSPSEYLIYIHIYPHKWVCFGTISLLQNSKQSISPPVAALVSGPRLCAVSMQKFCCNRTTAGSEIRIHSNCGRCVPHTMVV